MSTTAGIDPASFPAGPPHAGSLGGDPGVDPQLVLETRNQIRALVQEITHLAESDVLLAEFYDGLLTRIVSALAATGGAIWSAGEDRQLKLACRVNFECSELEGSGEVRHALLLKRVMRDAQPLAAPPKSGFPDDEEAGNPSDQLLLLAPITMDREVLGLIEVLQRPGAGPTTQRGYLRFLSQMCDLAGRFQKNHRLREYAERESLWQKLEQFLGEVHGSLDLDATAFAVVNESRRLIDCDRVALALRHGSHCRIEAVSGLDSLDRRTEEVSRLTRLVNAVVRTGEAFWRSSERRLLPPQIEAPLEAYVDRSHTRAIAILPLWSAAPRQANGADDIRHLPVEREILGALILERMADDRWTETHKQRAGAVVHFATPAIDHALLHDRVFLRPLWTWIGSWQRRLDHSARLKLGLGGAVAAVVIALLALFPAPFDIGARGKLQPSDRQEIFAQEAGTVVQVPVRHGQTVQAGDLLVALSNTEIEVQLTELLGRQRVAQEQLEASQRSLLDSGHGGRPRLTAAEENRLGGEILQLRQTLVGIAKEIGLVRQKQANLAIHAEQAGEVVTWQVEKQLLRRPVLPGQALMTVVDPNGPWELELYLPERRLKHVDAVSPDEPLRVTFMLSTLPGREFEGHVVEIERSAHVRGEEGNTVLVRVALDATDMPSLRSDTSVTAKLHCGRRSLGYVWFCDLLEAVQTSVLFWL